jgi:hypothetical protein
MRESRVVDVDVKSENRLPLERQGRTAEPYPLQGQYGHQPSYLNETLTFAR